VNPCAKVTGFQRDDRFARTDLVFDEPRDAPFSPAWIAWPVGAQRWERVLELHRLVSRDGPRATFETDLDPTNAIEAPPFGEPGEFFLTYDEVQLAVMQDKVRAWKSNRFRPSAAKHYESDEGARMRRATDGEQAQPGTNFIEGGWDHEHCLLCSESLNDGDDGYESRGDWLCSPCFERFVRGDAASRWGDRVDG